MSKIKLLSEKLANQIAAGEVVERPASVVKEFLENSLDAGAGNIFVQVVGAGTRLIRVVDDGEGMDQDDVLLCLERHATSKLVDEQQLAAIKTLGFRGEAIASIASVSRLTITSRHSSSSLGSRAEVHFGRLMKVHEVGCAQGTTMEVRDLFGNVPARKKFLKSEKTELSHIEELVKNYGLLHANLGFIYKVGERELFNWPLAIESVAKRLQRMIGRDRALSLVKIDSNLLEDNHVGLQISGYLVAPDQTTATASKLRLFVNGRIIRDQMLFHAVCEGLYNFLMKGHRPAGVLFVDIDPATIDVNVHPAKQEIRFRDHALVHRLLVQVVRQAMVQYQQEVKRSVFGNADHQASRTTTGTTNNKNKTINRHLPSTRCPLASDTREPASLFSFNSSSRTARASGAAPAAISLNVPLARQNSTDPVLSNDQADSATISVRPVKGSVKGSALRLIGQLFDAFILCENEHGLIVIDQHAAHERLFFERFKKQFQENGVVRQILLFPKVIEVNDEEERVLRQYDREIAKLGIEIQEFGGNSFVVKAVPALMTAVPPLEIMAGIFTQFDGRNSGNRLSDARRIDNILADMACTAAIKAGCVLQFEEIEQLLLEMQEADIFSHCPHGRPVVKEFSSDEIKRWFYRT